MKPFAKGMELLLEAGAEAVEIFGDSKLVISQLTEEYRCESEALFLIWMQCRGLMSQFRNINFHWIRRTLNNEANDLAQMASGYKETDGVDMEVQFLEPGDWRADIFNYMKDSARGAPRRIRLKAMKYVLIGDDMFTGPWKDYCLNVWDLQSQIGSCMRFMREPAVLINRLIR